MKFTSGNNEQWVDVTIPLEWHTAVMEGTHLKYLKVEKTGLIFHQFLRKKNYAFMYTTNVYVNFMAPPLPSADISRIFLSSDAKVYPSEMPFFTPFHPYIGIDHNT